jgi:YVTN family beta-propeller protein
VSIELLSDTNPVAVGATLTYTATVRNVDSGTTASATGVVATVSIPAGVTFLSATSAQGVCDRAGTLVTCSLNDIPDNSDATVQVQVRPDVGGVTLVSNADVVLDTPDTNAANNTMTRMTAVTGAGSRRVWAANAGTNTAISIINPDTNASAGSITLNAPAYDIAFSPDGLRAYAVNFTTDNIAVIDTSTNGVIGNIVVAGPVRVEVGPDSDRLYVTTANDSVVVIDAGTLGIATTIPVGSSPNGLAVSPNGTRVYVANRNANSVSVIDTSSNTVVATVNVGSFPVEVALSPNGKRLYVTNFFDNTISVVDTAVNTVVATIDVGSGPQGIAVTPDGGKVYVANFNEDDVSVIDAASNSVVATPIVSGSPNGVVASPDGNFVYVTAYNGSALRVIDTSTNTVVTSLGTGSLAIAVDYARIKP